MYMPVYAVVVCLSVCVSVTLRYCIKMAKRRITQIMLHDRTGNSSFLTPNFTAKLERDHPQWGRQMQVGWVKIGHFCEKRAITRKRYKLDAYTVVSIKVEQEVVRALSDCDVSDNLGWPLTSQTTHFLHFSSPFISLYWVNVEISNLVHRLTIASTSLSRTKCPWKGRGYVTWTILNFGPPIHI